MRVALYIASLGLAAACVQSPEVRSDRRSSAKADDGAADETDGTDADEDGDGDGGDEGGGLDVDLEELIDLFGDESLTYYNTGKAILDEHCVSCHGATPAVGAPTNFRLDVYDDIDVSGTKTVLNQVVIQVFLNTMPPASATPLPTAARDKLFAWILGGGAKGVEPVVPSLTFAAPATANAAPTGDTYTVQVSFQNAGATATWSLYYATTAGATSGGTLVAGSQAVATTSFAWDMSALPDDEYFLYGVLTVDGEDYTTTAAGSVLWDNPSDNNSPPTIELSGAWVGNDPGNRAVVLPEDITYAITDADVGDTHTVKLEYKIGAGGAWQEIANGHVHATTYAWNGPMAEGTDYYLRVTVTDSQGATDEDVSSAPFGIAAALYGFDVHVKPILADCIGGGCHDPGAGDWNDFAVASANADDIITRAVDGTDMSLESGGAQSGTPLSVGNKLIIKLWRWQGVAP